MRNPWLTISSRRQHTTFASKKSAITFGHQWVTHHPEQSVTIYRRRDMLPSVTIQWDGNSSRAVLVSHSTKSSSRPPQGFAEIADTKLRELGLTTRRAREVRQAVFQILNKALANEDEPVAWTPVGVAFTRCGAKRHQWLKKRINFKFNSAVLEALQ